MKISLKELTIKDLTKDYRNFDDEGVTGYGGKLDIRPKYQRNFVYKEKQRDAVINTVMQGFPLNVMYWAVREDQESFEVIDGQQRTISICEYVEGEFSFERRYFHNLPKDEQDKFYSYPLMIYLCEGSDSEKLEWFKTINIAGEKLTEQELRNAVYSGSWVEDAKKYFSKNGCSAYGIGSKYLKGSVIRQEFLETAIKWISNGEIEDYMGKNQHTDNAKDLWNYFQKVIDWIVKIFLEYRQEMKGVEWGFLYNKYKNKNLDPELLKKKVSKLMEDEEVEKKSGIYPYLLDGKEKHLNLRCFSDKQKRVAYEKQEGVCNHCKEKFDIEEMDGDHVKPWSKGGKTDQSNCQMLCRECNRKKSHS